MDEYIIYLKGDVSGKSSKDKGHKEITVQLSPTTVEAGVYSGKLKLQVDKTGRVLHIEELKEIDKIAELLSGEGVLYVKNGKVEYVSLDSLKTEPVEIKYPVTSVNGKTGDVTIEPEVFTQTYKKGDYSYSDINGIEMAEPGCVVFDGNKITSVKKETPKEVTIKITGDVTGEGYENIKLTLNNVSVEKGGTGADNKTDALLNLWPTESSSLVVRSGNTFNTIDNKLNKGFLVQEVGGLPTFSEIGISDLPQIPIDKTSGVLPVSRGGTGVDNFTTDGFMFVENNEISVIPIPKEILNNIADTLKKLQAKIEEQDNYIKNVELSLNDQFKILKKSL